MRAFNKINFWPILQDLLQNFVFLQFPLFENFAHMWTGPARYLFHQSVLWVPLCKYVEKSWFLEEPESKTKATPMVCFLPSRRDQPCSSLLLTINLYQGPSPGKHRKNCECCPTQVSWKVKFNCLSVLSDLFAAFISLKVVAKCLPKWPAWKVSMVIFVRKLVEGCTQASLRLSVTW